MVVLRGEGRSFFADNDLKAIAAGGLAPTPHFQAETIEALEALSQAVIVSVRGHCFTGGLELALASDLIIASDTAMFSDTHGRFAMVPTWGMTIRHEKAMMVETVGMSRRVLPPRLTGYVENRVKLFSETNGCGLDLGDRSLATCRSMAGCDARHIVFWGRRKNDDRWASATL